jgi:predicted dehydrogenase
MIRAAIIGMGSRGRHLARCLGPDSPHIRNTAGATRRPEKAAGFAAERGIRMLPGDEAALADPAIDAVVLATPPGRFAVFVAERAAIARDVGRRVNRWAG